MDWLVVAIFVVPGAFYSLSSPAGRAHDVAVLAFVVAGGAALLYRRRRPVVVALVIAVLGFTAIATTGDTAGFEIAAMFAVYSVAAARSPKVAWPVLAALVVPFSTAVMLWYDIVSTSDGEILRGELEPGEVTSDRVASILVATILCLVAMAIGSNVRARRQHVGDLVERANSIARDRDQQAQLAAAAERTRIAREMHDVVAHSLTVMIALADGARAAGAKDPDLAAHALDELTATGRAALTDMRRVLGVLREPGQSGTPAPLTPADDVGQLEDVVERFRTAGLPVRLVRRGPQPTLEPALRQAVLRIVQESLTNVLRYAPLAPIVLVEVVRWDRSAWGEGDWLELRVVNRAGRRPGEGTGVDARALPPSVAAAHPEGLPLGTGRGIIGMQERAAVHGGTVVARSVGDGWEVVARLRIDAAGHR